MLLYFYDEINEDIIACVLNKKTEFLSVTYMHIYIQGILKLEEVSVVKIIVHIKFCINLFF